MIWWETKDSVYMVRNKNYLFSEGNKKTLVSWSQSTKTSKISKLFYTFNVFFYRLLDHRELKNKLLHLHEKPVYPFSKNCSFWRFLWIIYLVLRCVCFLLPASFHKFGAKKIKNLILKNLYSLVKPKFGI